MGQIFDVMGMTTSCANIYILFIQQALRGFVGYDGNIGNSIVLKNLVYGKILEIQDLSKILGY